LKCIFVEILKLPREILQFRSFSPQNSEFYSVAEHSAGCAKLWSLLIKVMLLPRCHRTLHTVRLINVTGNWCYSGNVQ